MSDNTNTRFRFHNIYCGSVEEIIDESGERQLLVSDILNQRVVKIRYDDSRVVWQIDRIGIGNMARIPGTLYPTCATRGLNGRFYICLSSALNNSSTGDISRIIEVTNDYRQRIFFEGKIANPQDIYYMNGGRLLISS